MEERGAADRDIYAVSWKREKDISRGPGDLVAIIMSSEDIQLSPTSGPLIRPSLGN